jgi:hypothetical protein
MDTMSTKRNNVRTANDTPSRVEADAVSSLESHAADVFLTSARAAHDSGVAEAAAYVAAVDAHGGKRGADAAVQRAIGARLTLNGFEPLSGARYSKMAAAFRALAGLALAEDGESWRVVYGLFNVSSKMLTASERDAIVVRAGKRPAAERLDYLNGRLIAARAGKLAPKTEDATGDTPSESPADTTPVHSESGDAPAAPVLPTDAAGIVEMLASVASILPTLTDDARIRIADAAQDLADAAHALTVPADASSITLTDAA